MESRPTKTSVSIKLTPTSKHFKCISCGELKDTPKDRLKLVKNEKKTDLFHTYI